ncbi:BRD4-interacting chromatin-remodeling complex-associated protein-like isoform X2 [Lissotriton helveticus]
MDDDDDCLFDLIGDPQALNYFLHGPGNKSVSDPKSSVKGINSELGEGSSDGLQLSSSLQFLEEDLETSSLPDINEDQPFDILQKSLQEANITEQTLAEEAYLDADVESSQLCAQPQLVSPPSASYSQSTDNSAYSGQPLHPLGITPLPAGASLASNTVGVQEGFVQHVGISVPNQQLSNCDQLNGPGQIQLISSFNNQPSMMTINKIDGAQIILKGSGQQGSPGGVLLHRHTPNGNSMFGNSNSSPVGHATSVPFGNANFQTSLPLHNIIIQRGHAPTPNKIPINIQPKSIQMDQHAAYNMNIGIQQHHIQGIPFASANVPHSSGGCQQMPVNFGNQQNPRNMVSSQSLNSAGSIVIHSHVGQHHAHQNQFLIPTSMPLTSSSAHHVQTINGQLMQTQQTHLVPSHLSAEHAMLNRNSPSMIRSNQPYAAQMLSNHSTSVQLVSGQTFSGPGGQVIVNHGSSQIVGGQMAMQHSSPTILHASPTQGNDFQGNSNCTTMSTGQSSVSGIPVPNQFTVVSSAQIHADVRNSAQTVPSGAHLFGDQISHQNRTQASVSVSHRLPASSSQAAKSFPDSPARHQTYSCCQPPNNVMNQPSPVSLSQSQDTSRQHQLPSHHSHSSLSAVQSSGCKMLKHPLGTAVPKQERSDVSLPLESDMQVDGHTGGIKRPAAKQLTKRALLQQLNRDQACVEVPDKKKFSSLNDAVQKLLSYHVFQGSVPNKEDLKKVDNEFESVASHLLQKTQAMLNKYRLLLLDDAMRINPSAEMVMIDRMFNQEERATLTREKRLTIVDPDSFQADFCCSSKFLQRPVTETESSDGDPKINTTSCIHQLQKKGPNTYSNTELTNHDAHHLVPNNTATLQKTQRCHTKADTLSRRAKDENVAFSLGIQKMNVSRGETCSTKPPECNVSLSESEVLSRRLKKPENGPSSSSCGAVETKCMLSLQTNISSEDLPTGTMASSNEPPKEGVPTKSSETAFKHIEEMKKNGRNSRGEIGCKSMDLEISHLLPLVSQEDCQVKMVQDRGQGVGETDSVLEAAVNSILEC